MADALRHPPRGFENLAREHLWRKKWHILEVVADWLREGRTPGGLTGHYRGEFGYFPPVPHHAKTKWLLGHGDMGRQ